MLRRLAKALHARVRVVFELTKGTNELHVAEPSEAYRGKRVKAKRKQTRIEP
jgi:hypothetical protein